MLCFITSEPFKLPSSSPLQIDNCWKLILNSVTEREAALEGLAETSRILGRFVLIEADVFNGSARMSLSDLDVESLKTQLRTYLIQLYSNIVKFQIQLVRRCDHTAFTSSSEMLFNWMIGRTY